MTYSETDCAFKEIVKLTCISKKESILQVGFIAQDLKKIQEETETQYLKLVLEDNKDKLEATPGNLLIPIIKAVQELNEKVKILENKVRILENR